MKSDFLRILNNPSVQEKAVSERIEPLSRKCVALRHLIRDNDCHLIS